jgi:hypothetical protein
MTAATEGKIEKLCKEIVKSDGFRRIGSDVTVALELMKEAIKTGRESALMEPAKRLVSGSTFHDVSEKTMALVVELENVIKEA